MGGSALALLGWPSGCLLVASHTRSQVIDHAAGGLGRWEIDSNTEWENGLPEKEARPPVTHSPLGRPGWWGMASPGYSTLPQELLPDVEAR